MYVSEISAIHVPFDFICARGKAKEEALVNSSATKNFINERMVRHLGIGKREVETPHRVFNVDRTENLQGKLQHYCLLRVKRGDQESLQKFFITSLGGDCAILGYPWLRTFTPSIDWKSGRVLGPKIVIETALYKWAREKEIRCIVAAVRANDVWEEGDEIICHLAPLPTHAAQEWAIATNKKKQTTNELPQQYSRHAQLFSEDAVRRFLPSRPNDMAVQLKPGAPDTMDSKIYPLTRAELDEWHKFVEKNKAMGRIQDSKSPWGAPVFFIKKKDGTFQLVQDYREVNKWTEREVYPMPHIEQILEQLHGKLLFTALDIRDGYNNI